MAKKYERADLNFDEFNNSNSSDPTSITDLISSLAEQKVYKIPTSKIESRENIRKTYDQDSLQQLSDSLKANGQLQPITVYPDENNEKFIIAIGHRRYKACVLGDIPTINCIITKNFESVKERIITQAVENEQRENISPREREEYMASLQDLGLTVTEIGHVLNKSKSWVSEAIKVSSIVNDNREIFKQLKEEPTTRDIYNARNLTKDQLNVVVDDAIEKGGTKKAFQDEMRKTKTDTKITDTNDINIDTDIEDGIDIDIDTDQNTSFVIRITINAKTKSIVIDSGEESELGNNIKEYYEKKGYYV